MLAGPAPIKSDFVPTAPLCFISTHLDDVALSCGHFVAAHPGSVVVTVLAGAPDVAAGPWDRLTTGRGSAREALALRREEDAEALAQLGATPVWLDLADGQYEPERPRDRSPIVHELSRVLDGMGAGAVVAPLGLYHPDHIAVADACRLLALERAEEFYLYLDMPYAQTFPATFADRLDHLGTGAQELTPFEAVDPATKRRAVTAYASQLRWVRAGLSGFEASMTDSERYWQVA